MSEFEPRHEETPVSTQGLKLLGTLVRIRLRAVRDPEAVRHLGWVADMTSALNLMAERVARTDHAALDDYLSEAVAFWRRHYEDAGLRLTLNGLPHDMPGTLHLPLAIILHEICGEVARLHQPGEVGAALAVAFSASGEDVGMVVTTTASPREDTPHAEARAMIEGLVTFMGGMTGWSDPRESGLTLRVRLPREGRSLQ